MVDNNVNPTLPQSSEVVVECSIEEGMSTYMEIGDEDGLDIADGIRMVDNLESKKDGSKDGIVFVRPANNSSLSGILRFSLKIFCESAVAATPD